MSSIQTLVQRYIDLWNETGAETRRAKLDAIFAEDCSYTDPNIVCVGRDAIDGYIGAVQKQFAGVSFRIAGNVDAHHDVARFTWHAKAGGVGEALAIGFDTAVTEGGRIKEIVGFLDKVPG